MTFDTDYNDPYFIDPDTKRDTLRAWQSAALRVRVGGSSSWTRKATPRARLTRTWSGSRGNPSTGPAFAGRWTLKTLAANAIRAPVPSFFHTPVSRTPRFPTDHPRAAPATSGLRWPRPGTSIAIPRNT